jgi:hypothetical protein
MKDPKRLVEVHTSSRVRRELRAGVELAPPPGAQRAVWAALNTSIVVSVTAAAANATAGAAAISSAASASAGAAAAGSGLGAATAGLGGVGLTTIFASVVVGLGAGFLVMLPFSEPDPGTGGTVPVANAAPPSAPARAAPRRRTEPRPREQTRDAVQPVPVPASALPVEMRPRITAAPSARRAAPAPALSTADPVADESSVVLAARRELSSGNPARAREILERGAPPASSGGLDQERAALQIEALARLGERAEAEQQARTFLARHPESPHAVRVRALLRR